MYKITEDIKSIRFSEEEWKFIKECLIEDSMKFHAAVYQEFKEFAPELTNECYDSSHDLDFKNNKKLFKRLKEFGFNVYGLDEVL